MKISTQISLAMLGLVAFIGTPSTSYAQSEKDGKAEATERQEAEVGSVEKTHDANTNQAEGTNKKKPSNKAGKVAGHNKELMKELSKEMNTYTNNQARLKRGREVAAKKNDTALTKKVKDLEPKVEAKHQEEMAKLHKKYGEKEVNAAMEVLENERKRGKSGKANRAGTTKKKNQNERNNAKQNEDNDGDGKLKGLDNAKVKSEGKVQGKGKDKDKVKGKGKGKGKDKVKGQGN